MPFPSRCTPALVGLLALVPTTLAAQRALSTDAPGIAWHAAADGVADLSPSDPTRPDSARLAMRALELSASGRVTRRGRGTLTLSVVEGGRVAMDEANVRFDLRWLGIAAGRFIVPVSDWWESHRHDNPLVDRPLAVQRFLGPEILSGTGVMVARGLPGGVRVIAGAVDHLVEPVAGRVTIERANRLLSGSGFVGRADWSAGGPGTRWGDFTVSASGGTSRVAQPLSGSAPQGDRRVNAVLARQSVVTGGMRWQSAGEAVAIRGEYLAQLNESASSVEARIPADVINGGPFYRGPTGAYAGGYATATWRVRRPLSVSVRGESLQDPELSGRDRRSLGAGVEWRGADGLVLRAAGELRGTRDVHERRVLLEAIAWTGPRLLARP